MKDLNRICMSGAVVTEPKKSHQQGGGTVCSFRMATNNHNYGEKEDTVYIEVVCFKALAESIWTRVWAHWQAKQKDKKIDPPTVEVDGKLRMREIFNDKKVYRIAASYVRHLNPIEQVSVPGQPSEPVSGEQTGIPIDHNQ